MNQGMGPFNLILLVVPAVALRIAIRALFGRKRMMVTSPMQVLLSISSIIMFALAGLGIAVGLIGFWPLLIPLPIIGIVMLLMLVDRTRGAEHRGLIWALAIAAQRGIPLSEAARAYADETLGSTGTRAMALAEALERGEPLAMASRTARLRLGTAMRLAVKMGESLGLLGPAMRQQLDDSQQLDATLQNVMGRFGYLGLVVAFAIFVCTFVMLKIVPVMQRMFEEFGLKLPAMTRLVIDITSSGRLLIVPLVIVVIVALVASSGLIIAFIRQTIDYVFPIVGHEPRALMLLRQILRTILALGLLFLFFLFFPPIVLLAPFVPMVLYYAGWFPRNLPVIWRLFKRYDGALVMRGLALTVRRNVPLPQGVRLVAQSYPLSIVGQRLEAAAGRIEAGMSWPESLRLTGLIAPADIAVLSAGERVGNLHWALEEMADSALRRQIYSIQVALQILFPMALFAVGMMVFFFVTGFFLPIISLIQALA
jgi:type II secretory pathway component PulF